VKKGDSGRGAKFRIWYLFSNLPFLLLFLPASTSAFGQSYGLKFAYPTREALELSAPDPHTTYSIHSQAPKFGVTGELPLPANFKFEIDALYSQWSYVSTVMGVDNSVRSATSINAWDFAVLAKRGFFAGPVKPFLDGGAAFRAVNEDTDITTTVFPNLVTRTRMAAPEFVHQATAGFAVGAGLDFRIGKFHVVPEVRYTEFQQNNFRSPSGNFHSNLKQPMFVLGLQKSR
jgi:opacity protein-like surface antigen